MNIEWKHWCRLCASSDGSATVVFENKDHLLPDKIFKYLSISIENQDELPQSVCDACTQQIGSFDRYADRCMRVQNMFKTMIAQTDCSDTKVGLIRQEYLNEIGFQNQEEVDCKEVTSTENQDFLPKLNNCTLKKPKGKLVRKKSVKQKSVSGNIRPKRTAKLTRSKPENDTGRRVSVRLQGISQMQKDFAANNDLDIKEEMNHSHDDGSMEVVTPVPKKRGRSMKTLVGAAKRKAKVPRVMKPKTTKPMEQKPAEISVTSVPSPAIQSDVAEMQVPSSIANTFTSSPVPDTTLISNNNFASDEANNEENKAFELKPDENFTFDDGSGDESSEEDKDKTDTEKNSKLQAPLFRWECHVCNEIFRNWNSLSIHCRQVHEVPAQVVCICAKVLASRASIIKHRLKHTDGYKFRCEKCDKSFHRKSLYDLHILSHIPKEQQPFVCCKCARRFHCEALLRHHERVHLPKEERLIYPCTICSKKFSSRSNVSAHLKAVHFGERPFVCDQCGNSFTSKGILQEHLTIHSDETPFKCTQCKKSFKTKYRLKIHMDTHRETPYQCPMCPHQLSTRRTLRMHLLVHKDVKAYQCATCGKAFKRSKDLKNHHNLHTGRRPYTCTFCPRTFANGSNCRAHKRKMHPEELRIYEESLAAAAAAAENEGSGTSEATTQTPNPNNPSGPAVNSSDSHVVITNRNLSGITVNSSLQNPSPAVISQHNNNIVTSLANVEYERSSVFEANVNLNTPLKPPGIPQISRTINHHSVTSSLNTDYIMATGTMNEVGRVPVNHLVSNNETNVVTQPMISLTTASLMRMDTCRNPGLMPRSGHMSAVDDDSVNRNMASINMNSGRRGMATADTVLNHHSLASVTPLNLNVTEVHSTRQHHISESPVISEPEEMNYLTGIRRTVDSYSNSRHQIPNINSNLQVLRQQQHQNINSVNRTLNEPTGLNRMQHSQHMGTVSVEAVGPLQGYATLNHLYQHHGETMPSAVAAAIAHSGTVAVPAFPGNPYIHHNMGYNRSGNM